MKCSDGRADVESVGLDETLSTNSAQSPRVLLYNTTENLNIAHAILLYIAKLT